MLTAASMIEASLTETATAAQPRQTARSSRSAIPSPSHLPIQAGTVNDPVLLCSAAPSITAGTPPVRSGAPAQPKLDGLHRCCGLDDRFHDRVRYRRHRAGVQRPRAGEPFALSAVNSATTITISQTSNVTPLNGAPSGTANAFLDFDKIFGTSTTRTGGTGLTVNNGGTATTGVVGTQSTYTGTGNAATPANLETRRLASGHVQDRRCCNSQTSRKMPISPASPTFSPATRCPLT